MDKKSSYDKHQSHVVIRAAQKLHWHMECGLSSLRPATKSSSASIFIHISCIISQSTPADCWEDSSLTPIAAFVLAPCSSFFSSDYLMPLTKSISLLLYRSLPCSVQGFVTAAFFLLYPFHTGRWKGWEWCSNIYEAQEKAEGSKNRAILLLNLECFLARD